MLAANNDPAMDRLAPVTFKPATTLVLANALFSVSLALTLATFFIGILSRLWPCEYGKFDSLKAKKSCLLRGLCYPGLRARPVDGIIFGLLVVAMVPNFMVGLAFLFWSFHPVMGLIFAAIVGFIVIATARLLAVLTLIPSNQISKQEWFDIQYVYELSQAWSSL